MTTRRLHIPISAYVALVRLRDLAFPVLLDSALETSPLSCISVLGVEPSAVYRVRDGLAFLDGQPLRGEPLPALRRVMAERAAALPSAPAGAGFQGGAIGYFAYEFGRYTETFPQSTDTPAVPDAWFGFYDTFLRLDHRTGEALIISRDNNGTLVDEIAERLLSGGQTSLPSGRIGTGWRVDMDEASFAGRVEDIRSRIFRGDVFQVNLSRRFSAPRPAGLDPLALYGALRAANPAPFAAYLDCGAFQIASTSPERFLKLTGRRVETRPIKGTIARLGDDAGDGQRARALAASAKDRAENVMIVDLLRNDLSKVARPGSVSVPSLCAVESYANLHHLVSTVEAELEDGRDGFDLIGACFPGGSITGAPKVKAMEIIRELEAVRRGVYCGSIGWLGYEGDLDLNIAIRTLTMGESEMVFNAGGGITYRSDPHAEFAETQTKASRLMAGLGMTDWEMTGERAERQAEEAS